MTRGIGRTWPLLAGAVLCVAGCTFPKWTQLTKKPAPESNTPVATAAADAQPQNTAAPRTAAGLLAAAGQKTRDWLTPVQRESATAPEPATEPLRGSTPPVASHDVVPPKYRGEPGGTPAVTLAKDATASPSLVRPSRRPPPDPAPKLPEDTVPVMAAAPVTTGPLFDRIASASRAWRTSRPATAAATPSGQPTRQPLVADTQLKFSAPDPGTRQRASVTRHEDIVKNVLRPATSASHTSSSSPPVATDPTVNPLASNGNSLDATAQTGWTAKRSAATLAPAPQMPSVAAPAAAAPATVAQTTEPVTPSPTITNPFAPPKSERASSWPSVAPQRQDSASTTFDLPQIPKLAALPSKSRPVARPSLITQQTAAPPVPEQPAADEAFAPLIDADEYRARLSQQPTGPAVPVRAASRQSQAPASDSWLAAYERLRQSTIATAPPAQPPAPSQAPAGSPARSLRSDDYVPPIPVLPAPILRR